MNKLIAVLVGLVVVIGAATFLLFFAPTHHSKAAAAPKKLPGVPVNLIACASGSTGVQCLAIYKNTCTVIAFGQSGSVAGAQPVDKKYCGQ